MKQFRFNAVSVAADTDGLADGVTAATSMVLAANNSGDNLAHEITVKGVGGTDHSGKTITVTGTDANGGALVHTMAGPNGTATVTTTGVFFLTVTSIDFDATAGASTFDAGWNANSVTGYESFSNNAEAGFSIGFGVDVVAGSPNYTVQHTYGGTWFDHPSITGETTTQQGGYTQPILAMRLKFSAAGSALLSGVTNPS